MIFLVFRVSDGLNSTLHSIEKWWYSNLGNIWNRGGKSFSILYFLGNGPADIPTLSREEALLMSLINVSSAFYKRSGT